MIRVGEFKYRPTLNELEKASGSYVMSLVAIIAGLPVPIVNLLATLFFYVSNRRGTYYVRWHCTQALLSQLSLLPVNSIGFWWTIHILFGSTSISNSYIAYIITLIIFNLAEFIATIYTAVNTRKGVHVEWWLYGTITNVICKENGSKNTL
jgi:hypothetical protein